jgi:hypothetical protein
MATSQEKTELVEELKGPHYYRITVNGYGGETVFSSISKEAQEYWSEVSDEHGDSSLVSYAVNSEEWTPEQIIGGESDIEFDDIDPATIPRGALFLHDDDAEVGRPWFEPPNEVFHNNQAEYDGAYMTIEKVSSMDYDATHIDDVIEGESVGEFIERIGEASDWEIEAQVGISETVDYNGEKKSYESFEKGSHVFQFHSAEKGTFWEGYLETPGLFDETKLKVIVDEDAAGNDLVWGFTYNGEEVDNEGGGDTNGKGYYAWTWKQEF